MANVAILIPCFHEPQLQLHFQQLTAAMAKVNSLWPRQAVTYWLIDDGADRQTQTAIAYLHAKAPRQVRTLVLSRHFGFDASIQAALANLSADVYVIADLLYPQMLNSLPAMLAFYFDAKANIVACRVAKASLRPKKAQRLIFHYAVIDRQVKTALLRQAAESSFSLDLLASIGFNQRQVAWSGERPQAKPLPKRRLLLALTASLFLLAVVLLLLERIISGLLMLNLAQLVLYAAAQLKKPPVRYVVQQIDPQPALPKQEEHS